MQSVVSYPNRGKWGKNSWHGNMSGYVIKDLIEHFKPKLFVDVCEGSGTSGDVCRDFGIEYVGLDLHKGNDFTSDYVLTALPYPADMVFSHPPYHNMVKYSQGVYPGVRKNDTSRCRSVNEFLEMSQVMLLNQREATKQGGIYSSLIGDLRKNGSFWSFQADFIKMMPKDELLSVTIKLLHNCKSDKKIYNSPNFVAIQHEYLLIWKKKAASLFAISLDKAVEHRNNIASTWRCAIRIAMMRLNGKATLSMIYEEVLKVGGKLIANNQHWQAKIRQVLQKHYTNVQRGVWAV